MLNSARVKSLFMPTFVAAIALSASVALLATPAAIAQLPAQLQNNPNVATLNPARPVENDGKIEVLEFFAYGCPHCAALEPKIETWAKKLPADVKLKRVPALNPIRGIDSVPLFYTLEAMGLQEKLRQKIFDAANVENVILGNPATLNTWLEKHGVDLKHYAEVQKSFSIQNKIARAKKMSIDYMISSVPMMVVNGRYAAQVPGGSSGQDQLFVNVDQLITSARAANKTLAATEKK